ncbi:alpha/beta hydrolase [Flavobacterium alkalisoli]|uniref:alpha/beta hydrolase n=1 Tax=Flavobacterium alkalisoli TaxID=2602769 RepID=UPI003A943FC9
MKKHLLLLFVLLFSITAKAQEFKTLTYFVNDSTKLELDLFIPKKQGKEKSPLLIHVHGGGFAVGTREWGHHIAKHAACQGYVAASISYTLYMKDKKFSCDGILSEKVKAFQIAANQLWQATLFFIKNSEKYNIDTSKIFISGSSAGAETVLHATYWNRDLMNIYPDKLPASFKYAGVISGAGAIMDLNLITKESVIPTLLFHGSCDPTVPYGTAAHHYCPTNASGWLMLFGSYSIYNHILDLDGNTKLVTYCNGGHEYSDELFSKDPQTVVDFMNNTLNGKKEQSHIIISTNKECKKPNGYSFCD